MRTLDKMRSLYSMLEDCTYCSVLVASDHMGLVPSLNLEQARAVQAPLCTSSVNLGVGLCSEVPLEGMCPVYTTMCSWLAPPSPPPPPPSPPPHPPTAPMVKLNAQAGRPLEAQAEGVLGIKYDGGSTSSISEFVATSDAKRSAVEDNSILYVATRTSLLMCVIILLSFGVIEVLRCLAKEWRIYRITTRRRSGLRLTSVDMMESGESPTRVGPEQAREAPEAPEACSNETVLDETVDESVDETELETVDETELETADGCAAKSHRVRSNDDSNDDDDDCIGV